MNESEVPAWAINGLREARRRANELIAQATSGGDTWLDEHAQWWLNVLVPFEISVTAQHETGEYLFKPGSNDEWSVMEGPS